MIQIHRLEGFYWVAKTGGYASAARAFPYPITQPAVHQQVKKLEQELDVSLFERIGKDKMQLTHAGVQLHKFFKPFYEGLPAVLRAVRAGEKSGELIIYAEPLMLRHLLPDWLRRLKQRCTDVQIDLRELSTTDVSPLRSGDADLLVGYLPNPPDDIATMKVASVVPFIVAHKDHPKAKRKSFTLRDLKDDTFIAYNKDLVAHELQIQALALHGIEPASMMFSSAADTILGFVESGLGYSLVPSLASEGPKGTNLVAKPLLRPKLEFDVVAAWRKDTPENPILDAALETAPKPSRRRQ